MVNMVVLMTVHRLPNGSPIVVPPITALVLLNELASNTFFGRRSHHTRAVHHKACHDISVGQLHPEVGGWCLSFRTNTLTFLLLLAPGKNSIDCSRRPL